MTVDDGSTSSPARRRAITPRTRSARAAAPNFARLAGLRIKAGFLREAAARIGGTAGCTHLRELLQQMGTTAHQTVFSARGDREAEAIRAETGTALTPEEIDARVAAKFGGSAKIVNTCIAYDEAGPIVQRRWPHLYKGADHDKAADQGEPRVERPPILRRPRPDRVPETCVAVSRLGGGRIGKIGGDQPSLGAVPRFRHAPCSVAATRKYCITNTRTALVRPPGPPRASTRRTISPIGTCSRWQIS